MLLIVDLFARGLMSSRSKYIDGIKTSQWSELEVCVCRTLSNLYPRLLKAWKLVRLVSPRLSALF